MNYDFLSDKVQLLLPLALGQRYGVLPEQLEDAAGNTGRIKLEITVEIQMSGRIRSITSPSHQGLSVDNYPTHYGRPSRRRAIAKLSSKTYLERDFELVIQANELERSRCFVENDPRLPGTVALQLMLIPHFKLPPVLEQEYLFLIDRSGSMTQLECIEMAQQCVTLLLRCLPNQNTVFNIFDFAETHNQLWPQSRPYDNRNVQEAVGLSLNLSIYWYLYSHLIWHSQTNYIYGLEANGGTELSNAMQAFLGSRRASVPTAAFVLTDGLVDAVSHRLVN